MPFNSLIRFATLLNIGKEFTRLVTQSCMFQDSIIMCILNAYLDGVNNKYLFEGICFFNLIWSFKNTRGVLQVLSL